MTELKQAIDKYLDLCRQPNTANIFNAMALHYSLNVKTPYSLWIAKHVKDLQEGVDYQITNPKAWTKGLLLNHEATYSIIIRDDVEVKYLMMKSFGGLISGLLNKTF